ncbi:MAG: hypothetical protein ACRBG0_14335 [Lewinella sp.]|jgi:hypothetical protein
MMKNFLSVLAIASAVLCCTQVQANTTPAKLLLKVEAVDQSHLLLHLANLQQETTVLRILDFDGAVYLRKTITEHNGYALDINLEDLPDGRYFLRVNQKGSQVDQIIFKGDGLLLVSQPKSSK